MDYFLTIAASDNSGGAGIQQDIKVSHELGYWPLSAISGITVQDFKNVYLVEAVKSSLLQLQINQCLQSFPLKAIKIGAICSKENLDAIVDCLKNNSTQNIVLDTVLSSTGGTPFLDASSILIMRKDLFPLCKLITPNKHEFEQLVNTEITTIEEGIEIAQIKCNEWNTAILLKGGHFKGDKLKEALITKNEVFFFEREWNNFTYSHGTGCTLSSAIACFLGKGEPLKESYIKASKYVVEHFKKIQEI